MSELGFPCRGGYGTASRRRPVSGESGFTLLELLIAVTMLGVIVLIVTAAMRLGLRSIDSGERRMESLERLRASVAIVDSQIQSQIPLTYNDDGSIKFYFKGGRESLVFPTNHSLWGGQAGYVIASYAVVSDDRGRQSLSVSENIVGQETTRETKLFDALQKISFEYYYKEPTEEEGTWVEQWTDETTVPDKVRLHIVDESRETSWIIPMRTKRYLSQIPAQAAVGSKPVRK